METIRVFLGFDQREAAAFHVCHQSIIERATCPVAVTALAPNMLRGFDTQGDGSNAFTLSRYLIPLLCNYEGWAIFLDGDMVLDIDIAQLWEWKNTHKTKAVAVVKHDYQTRHPDKYIGTPMRANNADYPKKNWSSVVLWNCAHPGNRVLTEAYVRNAAPSFLHRFEWLGCHDIGALTAGWNYLVGEDPPSAAHVYHFTCGIPGISHYADWHGSWRWHHALLKTLQCAGEDPVKVVQRAQERIGAI